MNAKLRQVNIKKFSFTAVLFIGLLGLVGLQGCSSSSSPADTTPPITTDQNASGLFTGGITLNSGTQRTDLRAFVHEGRIIIFSVSGHFLFDGQIDNITLDNYTATFDIYELGVKTEPALALTGTVVSESKVTVVITGTTNLDGEITLDYDALYERGASFARVDTDVVEFAGSVMNTTPDATTNNFDFSTATVYNMNNFAAGSPDLCLVDGTYGIPDSSINIYILDDAINASSAAGCTMSQSPNYTGFAAAVDGNFTDSTLLYAVTNGENAQFAILEKRP